MAQLAGQRTSTNLPRLCRRKRRRADDEKRHQPERRASERARPAPAVAEAPAVAATPIQRALWTATEALQSLQSIDSDESLCKALSEDQQVGLLPGRLLEVPHRPASTSSPPLSQNARALAEIQGLLATLLDRARRGPKPVTSRAPLAVVRVKAAGAAGFSPWVPCADVASSPTRRPPPPWTTYPPRMRVPHSPGRASSTR